VFGGFLASIIEVEKLTHLIEELKVGTFSTSAVEVKSNWLRIPHERKSRYLIPYGLAEETLKTFVEEYYRMVAESAITFIAAVVDKVHMVEDYGEDAYYPPALAYEFVLQRVEMEAARQNWFVHVTIDNTTGKTPRQTEYRTNLLRQHKNLRKNGSRFVKIRYDHILPGLSFADSAISPMIQVADIAAYNVFRQFRDHWEAWEIDSESLDLYPYLGRLIDRFCQSERGVVAGWGIVKFPTRTRKDWGRPK